MTEVVFSNEMDEEMTLNMGPHHPSTHGSLLIDDGDVRTISAPSGGEPPGRE